jgi:monoamine oxidase
VGPFRARAAIVTLPIGVLRDESALTFTPEVSSHRNMISRIEMGHVAKVVLRFRSAFWEEAKFLEPRLRSGAPKQATWNFLHTRGLPFPTWWTTAPSSAPLLTAWSGGPAAQRLMDLEETALIDVTISSLSKALAIQRSKVEDQLQGWFSHNWSRDPYSRGAYSYAGVGGTAAQKALSRPIEETIYFAGEATESEETGTVSGALASGLRAARRYLASHEPYLG